MPTPKIYTKTGDKGTTSLFGGKRVSKFALRVEAYGTVDELNSLIGVAIAEIREEKSLLNTKKELINIQNDLLDIGSGLAGNKQQVTSNKLGTRIQAFEKLIDEMTAKLPELRNFILPGGSKVGSLLHFSRTVCRRVERRVVQLSDKEEVDEQILKYFNRLSDLLFTMARLVNFQENKSEQLWKK